jgi:diguanylate cyclase (GGDEF)-like protein
LGVGQALQHFDFIGRAVRAVSAWLLPPVPAQIRPALQQAQFDSVRKQVPMLLAVAALNTLIIMAVCANDGLPAYSYMWMSALVGYCMLRMAMWVRRLQKPIDKRDLPRLLRLNVLASLVIIAFLAAVTTYTFAAGTFQSMLLVPMSLGFGTMSIAHCLYTLRPAAIGTTIMGLFPSSVAMLLIGPFEAQMLGVAMLSVGLLMVRFVAEQYDQLIIGLTLAHENQRLAFTDPLTGLANRRATMAALDAEMAANSNFAVALIDIDGFKQVNDAHGHHAGDQLLCEIAIRLEVAANEGDEVGRLGGDEFIAVFRNVSGTADCAARSNALLAALCRPVSFEGQRLIFGASLGFAVNGLHGQDIEKLLQSADRALYAAKRTPDRIGSTSTQAARLAD